jgi:hypothetical protein
MGRRREFLDHIQARITLSTTAPRVAGDTQCALPPCQLEARRGPRLLVSAPSAWHISRPTRQGSISLAIDIPTTTLTTDALTMVFTGDFWLDANARSFAGGGAHGV